MRPEAPRAEHTNTAICRIKPGRSLQRQKRFAEAQKERLAGYERLVRTASPTMNFVMGARRDLIAIYDSLSQRAKSDKFRTELSAVEAKPGWKY